MSFWSIFGVRGNSKVPDGLSDLLAAAQAGIKAELEAINRERLTATYLRF